MIENIVDDLGTTQDQARQMLENLLIDGFEGDSNQLAIALGKNAEDIDGLLSEETEVDEDLVMKMRGIAMNREIEIE